MAVIFHITSELEWTSGLNKGYYDTNSLREEGFIHCCHQHQIKGVLDRYFKGRDDLVWLEIETEKLTSPFYYEWSPTTADEFPHIYGVINLEAVNRVELVATTN